MLVSGALVGAGTGSAVGSAVGSAKQIAGSAVLAPVTHSIEVTGVEVGTFPAFSSEISRYAITTGPGTDGQVTLTASTSDPTGEIRIDGVPEPDGVRTVEGLTEGDEVSVIITDTLGVARHSYIYLPSGFPALERVTPDPAPGTLAPGLVLLTLGQFFSPGDWFETGVDINGVPAFVRSSPTATFDLQRQPNGNLSVARVNPAPGAGFDVVELADDLSEVAVHRAVGLVNTDPHDAILEPDGTAWLVSYEVRGLMPDNTTPRVDGVVQRVDPDGTVGFEWSTEDYVDLTVIAPDAANAGDYSHINSIQLMLDGNLLVSMRHFSSVFKVATHDQPGFEAGEVIWQLGGRYSSFEFPPGENGPCAQHTARELPNGDIMVFDNGSGVPFNTLCVDQADPAGDPIDRAYTRIVSFTLDENAGTATPSVLYAPPTWFAYFAGSTQPLSNGNTVVGWAAEVHAVASEVDASGALVWELRLAPGAATHLSYRAHKTPVPDVTAPTVSITTPDAGARLRQGEQVAMAYECRDRGGSSLATCVGSTDNTALLDTSRVGEHEVQVSATDGAGHETIQTRTYTVVSSQADAAIKVKGSGRFVGVGTYGAPRTQRVKAKISTPGKRATLKIRLTNTGSEPEALRYSVEANSKWFRLVGRTRGGGTTPVLAPGERWTMTLQVVRRARTAPGRQVTVRIPVRPVSDASGGDAVSARVRASR